MKKFRVTVTRTTEYEVTVDETKWNNEQRKHFERYFWPLEDYEDSDENPDVEAAAGFAQGLAEQSIRLGVNTFIEGFGQCARDEESAKLWNSRDYHKDNQCTDGLYIEETDDDVESEIEDITDKED
jgi:ferredoxin-thioredoxin reductase catalytic subunit